jgi:hydrogenase nickel incorporation protein HypA/HybF
MHELSIARNLIEIVCQHLQQEGDAVVKRVKLRIGQLTAVHPQALQFSFEVASDQTLLQGAVLDIETLPVIIFCSRCQQLQTLPGIQKFHCPKCDTPSTDIRQGRELEIEFIEVVTLPRTQQSGTQQ